MSQMNPRVIELLRSGADLPPGMHRDRLLLLTTTGARTGREHVVPLMALHDGERLMVLASAAGSPRAPDWYRNVRAHPDVVVEAGAQRFEATATTLEGAEREQAWAQILAVAPFFADHQVKAGRTIPVVALTRR